MPMTPSFRQNRVEWNKAWERELDIIYGTSQEIHLRPGITPPSIVDSGKVPRSVLDPFSSDSAVQILHQLTRQLCTLQQDLSKKVALRCAEDDFEEAWKKKCTAKEREKWMLEGLYRTCDANPDFEDMRRLAPETRLSRLNFQSGQGFLDLIHKLILQDVDTIPENYRAVPNIVFDIMNGRMTKDKDKQQSPGRQVHQKMNDCRRTLFLTLFLWSTILAFYDESEEYGLIKTTHGSQGPSSYEKHARETGDKKLINHLKEIRKESQAISALAERACTSCERTTQRAGVQLKACQQCKSIGRYVYYCSKECQTKDWKSGRPPHKTVCGNETAYIESILESGEASSSAAGSKDKGEAPVTPGDNDLVNDWGRVEPGITRSPALLHQLKLLKETPNVDYIFVRPYPQTDQGIVLGPERAVLFKMCMKRAVCGPAPDEVLVMYKLLEGGAATVPGYGKEGLKKQLQREYGVDIDVLYAEHEKVAKK